MEITAAAPSPVLRREIGVLGVAATTINIVMGLGLFVLPAPIGALGGYAPAAIVLCAFIMGAVALTFAEASSRVPATGGAYGFVAHALGPIAATVTGGLILVSGTLAGGAILAAAIDQLRPFAPWAGAGAGRAALIVALCTAFAWNALRGAGASARSVELTMALKLAPLLLFLALAATLAPAPTPMTVAPTLATAAPVLVLGIYLFAGLESGMVMNGEVRDPVRTIPRGLFLAIGLFTLLAVAIQIVAGRALGAALPGSTAPLVAAAARVNGWLPVVIAAGAVVSMLGCAAGLAIANPRTIYAFAEDGLLPSVLGRIEPRRATPWVAIVLTAALFAVLAITGDFTKLAVASSLASMAVYVLGAVAFFVLRRRGVALAGPVVGWRLTPVAAAIAIAANVAIIAGATTTERTALGVETLAFVALALVRRWRARGVVTA